MQAPAALNKSQKKRPVKAFIKGVPCTEAPKRRVNHHNQNDRVRVHADSERAEACVKSFNKKRPVESFRGKLVKPLVQEVIEKVYGGTQGIQEPEGEIPLFMDVPNPDHWDVIDYAEFTDDKGVKFELAMVSFTDEADVDPRKYMKGIIFDMDTGDKILNNCGEIPITCLSSIALGQPLRMVSCKSINLKCGHVVEDANPWIVDEKQMLLPGIAGVVVRTFRYRGVNFITSNKSLSIDASRYSIYGGHSLTFAEMWKEAEGPSFDQLFDLSKPYSPVCYTFNICHPLLFGPEKQLIKFPHVIFLGNYNLEDHGEESSTFMNLFEDVECIEIAPTSSGVKTLRELTIDQANERLIHGYHRNLFREAKRNSDFLTYFGESIFVQRFNDDGSVDIIRVNSPSYQLRSNFRGDITNMFSRFGILVEDSETVARAFDAINVKKCKNEMLVNAANYMKALPINKRRIEPLIKNLKAKRELVEIFKEWSPESRAGVIDEMFKILSINWEKRAVSNDDVKKLFLANMFYMTPFTSLEQFFEVYDLVADSYGTLTRRLIEVAKAVPDAANMKLRCKNNNTYHLLVALSKMDLNSPAADIEAALKEKIPCSDRDVFVVMADLKQMMRKQAATDRYNQKTETA